VQRLGVAAQVGLKRPQRLGIAPGFALHPPQVEEQTCVARNLISARVSGDSLIQPSEVMGATCSFHLFGGGRLHRLRVSEAAGG
jgi:hypothetical protein